jgi:hypothetical protein
LSSVGAADRRRCRQLGASRRGRRLVLCKCGGLGLECRMATECRQISLGCSCPAGVLVSCANRPGASKTPLASIGTADIARPLSRAQGQMAVAGPLLVVLGVFGVNFVRYPVIHEAQLQSRPHTLGSANTFRIFDALRAANLQVLGGWNIIFTSPLRRVSKSYRT